ncbi:unnamed protein product [Symbiodinium microadriaticum]|nr:unnamed protein product [Symbiodinium microadriaticum]CAE7940151.1 unnamed protein product [Symbiodinium sp. KB8]
MEMEQPAPIDDDSVPIFLAVSGFFQALCLIKLLHIAIRNRDRVASWFRSLALRSRWLVMCFSDDVKTNAEEEQWIAREVCLIRLRLARGYSYFLLIATCASVVSVQLGILQETQANAPAAFYWTILLMFVLCTVHLLFPKMLQRTTLDMFYVAIMAAAAFLLSPLCTNADGVPYMSIILLAFLRLPASSFASRASIAFTSNIATAAVVVIRAFVDWDAALCQSGSCSISRDAYFERVAIVTEVSAFFLVAGVSLSAEVILRRTVQQGRQYRQLNAATSLLRLACDAVLELDEDLCLTEHSPELAAILLRDRPGSSLAGVPFTDFVATKEEAARAEQALNKMSFEDLSASAFSTRLVDTNSSKFCTELLQVKYCKIGDTVRHLIGLREITDQESLARPKGLDATFHGDANDSSVSCPYKLLSSAEASPVGLAQEGSRCMSVKSLEGNRPRPIIYMILDMQSCTVGGASLAAASLVGTNVSELFPGRASELLQGFWEEVDRCEDASEVAVLTQKQRFFSEWLVQWSPQQADFIDGFVQVLQDADGTHQLLLHCVASARSPLSLSGISDSGRSTGARPSPSTSAQALSVLPGMPLPDVQSLH